ncbi:MAG: lysophospholipid acyltransferase family protein [Spirochaetota bacterium]
MKALGKLLTWLIRLILRILCTYDKHALDDIPSTGPLIIVVNHINFLDVPLISTLLGSRKFFGLTKRETWDNWLFRLLAQAWGGIPVDRDNPGMSTFRLAHKALDEGGLLFIAPEGTRSGDGRLLRGKAGPAAIALRSHAAVIPMAHFGGEMFWENVKRLRKTRITFRVGPQFVLRPFEQEDRKKERQIIADQIMMQIARLLPSTYRGYYEDETSWSDDRLTFLEK